MPEKVEILNYFFQGFGIFLGVVAGTAVTICSQWLISKRAEKQKIQNIKIELTFMQRQIKIWLTSLSQYRNAINGDALDTWADYIDVSKILRTSLIESFATGLVYKRLDDSLAADIQLALTDFSIGMEQVINQKISEQRMNFDKKKAIIDLNFFEKKLKQHEKSVINALKCLG